MRLIDRDEEIRSALERDGFAIVPDVLDTATVERLRAALEGSENLERITTRAGVTFGSRSVLQVPFVREVVSSGRVRALAEACVGPQAFPVRGLFFDKQARANWRVPWHQDLVIAVRSRGDVPGFTAWSVKAGVPHVQPPASVLERILTLRLHLDDADSRSGAPRVLPGSHAHGRLSRQEVARWVESTSPVTCEVPSGGAVLMRPLLLHASSPAERPARRRVIHVELAVNPLPGGLEWNGTL